MSLGAPALSFGLVHRMVDIDGEAIDESTQDDDVVTVGWFAPMTLRYGS